MSCLQYIEMPPHAAGVYERKKNEEEKRRRKKRRFDLYDQYKRVTEQNKEAHPSEMGFSRGEVADRKRSNNIRPGLRFKSIKGIQ